VRFFDTIQPWNDTHLEHSRVVLKQYLNKTNSFSDGFSDVGRPKKGEVEWRKQELLVFSFQILAPWLLRLAVGLKKLLKLDNFV